MRQRYCTATDRANERTMINRIAQAFELDGLLMPPNHDWDGELFLHGGGRKAIIEVKRRNFRWGQHADVFLDKRKIDVMLAAIKELRVAAMFAVLTNDDEIYWTDLHPKIYTDARYVPVLRSVNVRDEWDAKADGYALPNAWFWRL